MVMNIIRSTKNPMIKQVYKLKSSKGRKAQEAYLLEGIHLVDEAIKANAAIKYLFISEEFSYLKDYEVLSYDIILLSASVMEFLSSTETNQGIIALVNMEEVVLNKELKGKYLLLDAVQDPGNLGTIVRTADAAGFTAVILGQGSVDLYNDKVLRSMQGSQYHIPIVRADLTVWLSDYAKIGHPIFGSALDSKAKDYQILAGQEHLAIIVGNEGNGISKDVLQLCTHKVMIPIYGKAESLNVGVAAALLTYKAQESIKNL